MTDQKVKKRRTVDLNKKRAARLEALGEGPRVKFGATVFECPPELPFMTIEAFGRMETAERVVDGTGAITALTDALRSLLGEQLPQFLEANPSTEDMVDFITTVFTEYGVAEGESAASPAS